MSRKVGVIIMSMVLLVGTICVFASDALMNQEEKSEVTEVMETAEPEATSETAAETSPEPVLETAEPEASAAAGDDAVDDMGAESDDVENVNTDSSGNNVLFSEKFYSLASYLKSNIDDEEKVGDILTDYIYYRDVYMLSEAELDYIADLIISGDEAKDIIEITNFWLGTNEDVSVIGEIYGLKEKFEGSKFWIENAFNKATEYKCGELNSETLDEYLSEGLTADDINTANILCRKGVYTIQEILEKKLEGANFVLIANEVSNEELLGQAETIADESTNELLNDEVIEDSVIINCEEIAALTEAVPAEILARAANGENMQEELKEKKKEKYAEIYKSLRNIGILSETDGDLNE